MNSRHLLALCAFIAGTAIAVPVAAATSGSASAVQSSGSFATLAAGTANDASVGISQSIADSASTLTSDPKSHRRAVKARELIGEYIEDHQDGVEARELVGEYIEDHQDDFEARFVEVGEYIDEQQDGVKVRFVDVGDYIDEQYSGKS